VQENSKAEFVELHESAFRISHAFAQRAMSPVKSMCQATQHKDQLDTPVQVNKEMQDKLG
jgi:hypothetical protein